MTGRTPTEIDGIAERHIDATFDHDPALATMLGAPGHEDALPALDPDWYAARSDQRRAVLAELNAAQPTDFEDRVTAAALREVITADEAVRALGREESALNNIDSPVQHLRQVFDLMSTDDVRGWEQIATRLAAVPAAVAGYRESLRSAAERGRVVPRRQVLAGITQARDTTGPEGFFATFAAGARTADGAALPTALQGEVTRNAHAAAAAYAELVDHLEHDLLPQAGERDGVGREAYLPCSRAHLGTTVDPDETYEWGLSESARIATAMSQTADRISTGASVDEVVELLASDPQRTLRSEDAFRDWMQRTSDEAVRAIADVHFDIPEPIRTLECRIAPTHDGGIYYTGPSEDLVTRPGRMWWSVPPGVTRFETWKQRTTVYHEGVPGHHLQIAQTLYRRELLNRWRRITINNGQCEGWALYAEQLMAELGFLDDPADLLGMLDGQSLRAARVVLDVGVHCDLPAPAEVGGGSWDYEKAWMFLRSHSRSDEAMLRFELDRYLGWPGQAPCYSVGQRIWLQLRDDVRAAEGDGFDLIAFHRRALDLGSVPLDVLRSALLGGFD